MFDRRQFIKAGAAALLLPAAVHASSRQLYVAYINGTIWTGNQSEPFATALGTVGNRIAAVGKEQVAAATGAKTRIIDLKGGFVTPGFIDPHTHFLMGSQMLERVNLRQAARPDI